ncbi:MAG: hypothetical protein RLZZ511_2867 [Cyanobacteriota bacterium]|jgi:hypothetical protein
MQRFWRATGKFTGKFTGNLTVSLIFGLAPIIAPIGLHPAPSLAQMPAASQPFDFSKVEVIPPSPVEVLVVGAQPTAKLRLSPKKGQQQSLTMSLVSTSQASLNNQPLPDLDLPAIQVTLDSAVTDVAINGEIQQRFAYRQVRISNPSDANSAITKPLTEQLQALEGVSGAAVITDAGVQKSIQLRFPSTMTPAQQAMLDQLSQSMNNLASPLPTGPIGIGSRWRQVSPIMINGSTFTQTATYNLTDLKDNIATIAVDLAIATDTKVLPTNQPLIGDLAIQSMTASGNGQLTWDLRQLMPQQSNMSINVKLISEPTKLKLNGKAPIIATDTQITLSLTPAEP